jgi:hypothetical protein
MADVTVELSYQQIGELLRTPEMEAEMVRRGEGIMAWAIAHSPVGDKDDPHRGRYKESFHIEHGREGLPGATVLSDRAWCEVINDSPEALFVEYGNPGTRKRKGQQAFHPLLKALSAGGGD